MAESPRKEFHVTVLVKNNLLLSRRKEYGFSQVMMAKAAQVPIPFYQGLELMRQSPVDGDGLIHKHAQSLMDFFEVEFEELWPECVLRVKTPAMVREMAAEEMARAVHSPRYLLPDEALEREDLQEDLQATLRTLSWREEDVLRRRFGFDRPVEETREQVGMRYGVSQTRADQIEAKALRRLRHPKRSVLLERHLGGYTETEHPVVVPSPKADELWGYIRQVLARAARRFKIAREEERILRRVERPPPMLPGARMVELLASKKWHKNSILRSLNWAVEERRVGRRERVHVHNSRGERIYLKEPLYQLIVD